MNNYQELLDKVVKLAKEDLEFRKKLLEDANKAVKERFNEEIPTKVTFYESKLDHLVFVLPVEANVNAKELDEDTLEGVAGGKSSGYSTDMSGDISSHNYHGVDIPESFFSNQKH